MPTRPPSPATVRWCVRRYRAVHSDRAASIRWDSSRSGLLATVNSSAHVCMRAAHRPRGDDLEGQSADEDQGDGTRHDQPPSSCHRIESGRVAWVCLGPIPYNNEELHRLPIVSLRMSPRGPIGTIMSTIPDRRTTTDASKPGTRRRPTKTRAQRASFDYGYRYVRKRQPDGRYRLGASPLDPGGCAPSPRRRRPRAERPAQ